MNTYSAYKDSGEQWLGQIPAHWEMKRLAACFAKRSENWKRGETLELLSLLKDVGVVPYSEKGNIGNTAKTDFSQYKVARKGDLVINSMNVIIGSLGITPMDGYISPAYYAFAPREGVNTRYYNYILSLRRAQQNIRRFSKGIMEIRLKISANDFLSIQYPVPPKDEQEAMVAYLDEQTAQIDSAIAREQKMIDLLEERKQIIIQQAVTKGLNPNAPMKDSGIEWIGEMPEHWDLTRLKRFVKFISGFAFNSNSFSDSGVRVIRIGDISKSIDFENCARSNQRSAKLEQFRIRENDILIAMSGATTGKCCIAENVVEAYINQRVGIIRCAKPRFIYYALKTKLFSEYVNITNAGSAQPNISSSGICNYPLVMPTDEEQNQIVIYLDKHIANVDRAIEAREKMIALLQERKQIIINEVVTGKIKVS